MPPCPKHLNADAKKEWKRAGKILQSVGLMTELDMAVLAVYCDEYSIWTEATLKVSEMGKVYVRGGKLDPETGKVVGGEPRLNPYVKLADNAKDRMMKAAVLLGLSPSSRASLKVEKPKKSDPAEEFLAKCHR